MGGAQATLISNTLAWNGLSNLCVLHKGAAVTATGNLIACSIRSCGALVGAGGALSLVRGNKIELNFLDGVLVSSAAYGDSAGVLHECTGNSLFGNGGAGVVVERGAAYGCVRI